METLTFVDSIPLATISPLIETVESHEHVPVEIQQLTRLQRALGISDRDFCNILGAMGSFKKNPPRLIAGKLPPPTVSAWKSGSEPMPRWRLAQAIILVEFVGILREHEAQEIINSPDASSSRKKVAQIQLNTIKGFMRDLKALQSRDDVAEFLPKFRHALWRRLKIDAKRSEKDALFFQLWHEVTKGGRQ